MPSKVHLLKETDFPVVMYGCESWTMKKAEHQRIDAFQLRCWKRLESPLDCMAIKPMNPKGNQSWIFIGRADAEAEASILWPPDANCWFTGKDPDIGKDWRQEKRIIEHETVDNITDPMYMSLVSSGSWWWTGKPGVLQSMGSQRVRHNLVTEQQQKGT